ncbi:hypothetical protein M422DRAFT_186180, partial [Sphaerobolus stellatus SS14]
FLKPVSKTDYPDYYEIIESPMDLGSMMKIVKARKYKSKQEFAADLDLIWKNCFQYNSGPVSLFPSISRLFDSYHFRIMSYEDVLRV